MARKVIDTTVLITAEREFALMGKKIETSCADWFAQRTDAHRGKFARDAKGADKLRKQLQAELVDATTPIALAAKRDGGLGMKPAAWEKLSWIKALALVVAPSRVVTYKNYMTGAGRAHFWEKPFTYKAHLGVDKGGIESIPAAAGATVDGVNKEEKTAGAAKVTKAEPAAVKSDAMGALAAAIAQDPARLGELMEFARSKGWI